MPELYFKGKEFVYNHHLTVPYRPLEPVPEKSIGTDTGNLIIHGDNLHALKALLPRYAGKVDCIFIDPPYNTGGQEWSYNDNVNSPIMREWLSSNPVNEADMLRHDKWACMMYPRLKLLYELLSDDGSLWMTLDDNEVHHARCILDEIFGSECCVGQIAWQKRTSRENRACLSPSVDHLIVYSKKLSDSWRLIRNLLAPEGGGYANPDGDKRGQWKSIPFSAQGYRKNQVYDIVTPTGKVLKPPKGRCWGATEEEFNRLKNQDLIYWPKDGDGRPRIKSFTEDEKGLVPDTLWLAAEVGDTEDSKKGLLSIFSERENVDFHAPKPHQLIERIIAIAAKPDSIIVDSFAGSGTTAHAVLSLNAKDGGTRKFILAECEDYADTLTAERVRRVINGFEFKGTLKEELLRKNVTFTTLKGAPKLLREIEHIEQVNVGRFDKISKTIKDGTLLVVGEKKVTERTDGLGGGFTYYELGHPLDLDKLLTGEQLPDYANLGAWLFHTATGDPLALDKVRADDWYLGESATYHVWLLYRPDLEWLKSREAALTLTLAEKIAATSKDKRHLVFAPARFVASKHLTPLGVEHAPLPFALYRFEKD